MKNNKGYLIVELVLASVLSMIIAYFLLSLVVKVSEKNKDLYLETSLLTDKALMTNVIMKDINQYVLVEVKQENNGIEFSFSIPGEYSKIIRKKFIYETINENKVFKYGTVNENGTLEDIYEKTLNKNISSVDIIIDSEDNTNGDTDKKLKIVTNVKTLYSDKDYGINISLPYNSEKLVIKKFPTIAEQILADNIANGTYYDFHREGLIFGRSSSVYKVTDKSGLYTANDTETEDMDGDNEGETVYYFAGGLDENGVDKVNNWIQFGKDKATGNPLYWRIIRTNEDGGIRLLFVGINKDTTEAYIGGIEEDFNYGSSIASVGYTSGPGGTININEFLRGTIESNIKINLDTWYENNISCVTCKDSANNTYSEYISPTAIYCNDRSISDSKYEGPGFTYFAPYYRGMYKSPSYRCGAGVYNGPKESGETRSTMNFTSPKDKYSMVNPQAQLENGIALMTVDEILFAGGRIYSLNPSVWYDQQAKTPFGWWLLSPVAYNWNRDVPEMWVISHSGNPGSLLQQSVHAGCAIRPVVSLLSSVLYKGGNGTKETPYEVALP